MIRIDRGWWKLPVLAVAACLAYVELRGHLPGAGEMWAALRHADRGWLAAAVALQVVSTMAFAEQGRRLLGAFGVGIRARTSVAVMFARSAMATGLPGGSAVAAAYGYQQFRARGASRPVAGAVTVLCGVASVAGLAALYAGDALVEAGPVAATSAVVAVAALVPAVRRARRRPDRSPAAGRPPQTLHDTATAPTGRPPQTLHDTATAPTGRPPQTLHDTATVPVGRLRRTIRETAALAALVPARRWLLVLALAAVNWLSDLLCLLACLYALGLAVPIPVVGAAYLGAQLARQIPATAGGIGVIEAGLILAMTTTGQAPVAAATAAVLTYRLMSCWAQLPVGAACWAGLRSPRRPAVFALPSGHLTEA
ncbi:YbhN family protein [Actinoplanes sp. KI2]|uniref:lysylphosphatidylglycerol synthase transmembrane domain-containing protein n=1 Tax=Actinoplanes sp. KI2 TaxID=2983315 RepID=UPI0021D58F7A|nr:YbhN family protein [Actinoplanes sp. KI2]MCU7724336.1 YbhN family protein [Actinoplanes sp. KI2]